MRDTLQPILVFGATGRQGGAVATSLLQANWRVLALVRDPAARKSLALRQAGVETVPGSFADTEAIRAAIKDAYGVFSVLPSSLAHDDEVRFGCAIRHSAKPPAARSLMRALPKNFSRPTRTSII